MSQSLRYLPRFAAVLFLVVFFFLLTLATASAATDRPNVLFIAIDDLRPQLNCYDQEQMVTPNLDRIAAQGRRFVHHYVSVPTCGASRYALLTGRRPSKTGALGNNAFSRMYNNPKKTPAPESFVHLFRMNGYRTVGIGKVSHHPDGLVYGYNKPPSKKLEMPRSWDDMQMPLGQWQNGWGTFFAYADGTDRNQRRLDKIAAPPTESADVPDTGYPDGLIANQANLQLKELAKQNKPFFLAVGFFKPHLPFNAPKKYWDLYPMSKMALSPCPKPPVMEGRNLSLHGSGEMFSYNHPSKGRIDPLHHRHLRRGYYASVSYVDAQVGKVLKTLDQLGLADNTIVIIWGDHGWHLGDLTLWGKHSLYEWSLRSALIIRTPNMKQPGKPATGVVETLDLYPTLVDLCQLNHAPTNLDGVSIRALLDNPKHSGKTAAFGYWGKGGISMRTDRYRLIRYRNRDNYAELYDHQSDPYETINIAKDHPKLVQQLTKQLNKQNPTLGEGEILLHRSRVETVNH